MNERIKRLTELTLAGKMYVKPVSYKGNGSFSSLSRMERESSELSEYILMQEPLLTEYSAFTGRFNFDGSVVGDAFKRGGHRYTEEALKKYYLKPQKNLSTMEWQHATADYKRVLEVGLFGIIRDIEESLSVHTEPTETEFLNSLKRVAEAMIEWSKKCSRIARDFAKKQTDVEAKARLEGLADALLNVPGGKPSSFYEAVLAIYVCFSADPDSVGTLDRYLSPFYFNDIENGTLTRDEAKEYLQELFLMLQASTPIESVHFTRGGESHFCIGGYLPNGEDGFNELSMLIAESMVELPTYIPQLTLRWTKKLPKKSFAAMMELERRDPHKRIAFTNDEKRIESYTKICGFSFEKACSYTTVGCNEPAFLGAITGSTSKGNILRSVVRLFNEKRSEFGAMHTFDELYSAYEELLFEDLSEIFEYDNFYNLERARDINYISSLLFDGCIENAKSLTQGGGNTVMASPMLIGIVNVIDSLIVIKQLVFDEKTVTLEYLSEALSSNWQGYEDLRALILRKCNFFGNDKNVSREVSTRFYESLYKFYNGKKNVFGYPWLVGDLLGYNEHHKWFGELTGATPDGRFFGEALKFGLSQSEGKDKDGLLPLLSSIATLDKNAIGCGSTVTNISLDKSLLENDESFYKLVDMLYAYFELGGVHFQLTYVSKEDLIDAQKNPEKHASLRVRVTGFSDYFVRLKESIQNDIIKRTVQS
jgi:formate C-acetyltransferase